MDTLNVPYVRDEIKKFSQRYADRMEEHANVLATHERNQNNTLIKKKIISRLMYLIVL